MLWKMEMIQELQNLRNMLTSFQSDINSKIGLLEYKAKNRENVRREILLKALKLALKRLGEDEKNVISSIKSDAFDMHMTASKLESELRMMEKDLAMAPEDERSWRTEVETLKKKIVDCNFDEFADNLDLSVISPSSELLNSSAEKVAEVVQLQMPKYSPATFSLGTTQSNIANGDKSSSSTDSQQLGSDYFEISSSPNLHH